MAVIELKIHKYQSKGKWYYYAWRGGPRIHGEPGTPEFMASYNEAIANHRMPDRKAFRSVVIRYKESSQYQGLADSTKRNWAPWLDRISDHFGKLRTAQFSRHDRIRPLIRQWRGKYANTPRTADYALQVLSRVCAYAVDPLGELNSNPCEGIKNLYKNDRSEIIWTADDLEKIRPHASPEVMNAILLAAHTGLRSGDLVKMAWSHVGKDAIVMRTGKSRGKAEAVVPIYQELRDLLASIPKRSTVVLTSSKKRPWTSDGLATSFWDAKTAAWPEGVNLHFNDLRGTAATKFYVAGFSERGIAELMGWTEESVSRIIRRYVGRTAALQDKIRRLNEAREQF